MTIKRTNRGRIFLTTVTAMALWSHEITGQLSDGTWENATPNGHYEPWVRLDPALAGEKKPHVESSSYFARSKYNLERLLDLGKDDPHRFVVRDRMLRIGRLALALQPLGLPIDHPAFSAVEDMPDSAEEFATKVANDDWPSESVRKAMKHVNETIAAAYYRERSYDMKRLKEDLKTIRAAMSCIEFT